MKKTEVKQLNRKYIRIVNMFFENLRTTRTKSAIERFLRNGGNRIVSFDPKLPSDIKVVAMDYQCTFCYWYYIVTVESKEFLNSTPEEIILVYKNPTKKEKVQFT